MGGLEEQNLEDGHSHDVPRERIGFDRLISDLSAKFVNLTPDRVDAEIEYGLRDIVQILGLDRSVLAQFADDRTRTIATHAYAAPGVKPALAVVGNEELPWIVSKITDAESVAAARVDDLPEGAVKDKAFLKRLGFKSILYLPLRVGGEILGLLGVASLRAERAWPAEVVRGLELAADVFANAIARRRSDCALRAAEEKWQATFDSIHDLVMILDAQFRILQVNAAAVSFLGLPLNRIIGNYCHVLMHGTQACVEGCPSVKSFQTRKHEEAEIFHAGKKAWLLVSADPILDAATRVTKLVHTAKDITERKRLEEQLRENLREIENLKQQLEQENVYLREEIRLQHEHDEIVGNSQAMKKVLAQVEQVARTDATVLIQGETGTGKELLARAIHRLSGRKNRPLVTVNCASLPPTLIENELLGREKGAYTGAMTRMVGRFEVADGSTLFLDEIGELPFDLQSKLLRVLEEGRFERLGSARSVQVNVRVIAATNQDLGRAVAAGRFRKDLYYRLNVFPITVPPLRERPEDIPLLVWAFVKQYQRQVGKRIDHIPRRSMEALKRCLWPGNVRELRNIVEHAMIMSSGETLVLHLPQPSPGNTPEYRSLEDIERRYIRSILEKTGWRITGKGGTAEILGLKRTTLQSKMKKLGIKRPGK